MKSCFFCAALCLLATPDILAQYTARQFTVRVEPDVYYGTTSGFDGCPAELYLDLYKPVNADVCRPVLVLLHGGAWVSGDKREPEAIQIARDMAARGYVVASVNYRLGWHLSPPPATACTGCWAANLLPCQRYAADTAEVIRAAYRAMQDAKGAIRFLKSRSSVDSTSRDRFFAGGYDAGAATALYVGFLDKPAERPAGTYATGPAPLNAAGACPANYRCTPPNLARPDLGGIEGTLHLTKSFDASVAGVLSWSGTLWQREMLANEAQPPVLYAFHQKCDHIFPCFDGRLFESLRNCLLGCCPQPGCQPLTGMPVGYGGGAIVEYLDAHPDLGIVHQDDIVVNGNAIDPSYGCTGGNSGIPFCNNPNYRSCHDFLFNTLRMDVIANFLNTHMPVPSCLLATGTPAWERAVHIFPNPASERIVAEIEPGAGLELTCIRLLTLDGRLLLATTGVMHSNRKELETAGLPQGMYFVVLETSRGQIMRRFVLQ